MSEVKKIAKRSEIDEKYKWNEWCNYPNDNAWEEDFNSFDSLLENIKKFKGKFSESVEAVVETFCIRV
jgi:oligoendopeptidase F